MGVYTAVTDVAELADKRVLVHDLDEDDEYELFVDAVVLLG